MMHADGARRPAQAPHAALAAPTYGELVERIAASLARTGVATPRLEARDLIAAVLDAPRFWPVLHASRRPDPASLARIDHAVRRRLAGAPFQYAVGQTAFRFLTLAVDERVLIPRPETERLVELVLATPRARQGGIAVDVGTGSGAIALALASEGRFERVIATDVSLDALAVAQANARLQEAHLRAAVEFRAGAGLAPLRGELVDVIVSNPPYIAWPELQDLPRLVRDWEPTQALCCDDDGLAVTRSLLNTAPQILRPGGLLALEVDMRRAQVVATLAQGSGDWANVTLLQDYTGRDRFVLATRPGAC